MTKNLNISIVLYKSDFKQIVNLVKLLKVNTCVNNIYLIDNSPIMNKAFQICDTNYIYTGKNLGYGSGHNIAIRKTLNDGVKYHLVLNPDILVEPNVINKLLNYMDQNEDIGLIMPKIIYPNGQIQYLCKLIPTPFDLLFRRFLPSFFLKKHKDRFQLKFTEYDKLMDVPYLSGCFMFLKTNVLKQVGLFDERFFMYPEDIDLSRRIHEKYRTVYFPDVFIIHDHAQESYKSFRMLLIHSKNMIKYFNKWGWVFDSKRKETNSHILHLLKYDK